MSFSFGAKQPFGANTSFGAPQAGNFSFGAPTTTQPSLFGTPTTQAMTTTAGTGISFGAQQTQAPNLFGTPATTSGWSFGGTPATSAPAFGTPATKPTQSFGTSAPSAVSVLSLGTLGPSGSTLASSMSTGSASALTLGMSGTNVNTGAATAGTGMSFGAPAAGTGLSFGAPTTGTGLSFGAPTTGTGLNFGTPTTGTGLSFGAPATGTGLSFGAPATGTGISFGAPAAGTGLNFGTPATTSTAFSLGAPPASTPALGLSFGATPTTAPTLNFGAGTGLSTGLNLTTSASPGLSFGFSGISSLAATTSAPASVGLGGIANAVPAVTTSASKPEQLPKEQNVPNEIQQTIDGLKNFVKQQKSNSSDVARCSVKEFRKVGADLKKLAVELLDMEKQFEINRSTAEKMKYDTAKGLQLIEMAQRTYDTPLGLQYENNDPTAFFVELVDGFEREMQAIKVQIESTDKYVRSVGNPAPLNSQDLALGLKRIHEAFVALAGRLQMVHNQVELQKEQHLRYRKEVLNDPTDVFVQPPKQLVGAQVAVNFQNFVPPVPAPGPTPFNNPTHPSIVQAIQNAPPTLQPNTNTSALGFSLNAGQPFGGFGFGQSFGTPGSMGGFQLQKPPTGNKRGKQ